MEQVGYLILYMLAFAMLYISMPKILFSGTGETGHVSFFSNFIRMNLFVITVVYILAFFKLYELVAVIFVFVLVMIRNKRRVQKLKNRDISFPDEIYYWIYDYTDGLIHLPGLIKSKIKNRWSIFKKKLTSFNKWDYLHYGNVLFIFTYAAVMRFTDVFINAAPAMSDAYVTLAWIKYIGSNQLFYDGIYPNGFHIYMSLMQKVTSLDPMHILKFSGPVTSMLILYAIYFFVSKMLNSKPAGLVSATVYGLFGEFLTADVQRQVATNAQEFGFLFILPCLFFTYRYLLSGKKRDLVIAGTALAVSGLVHSLSFVYAAVWIVVVYVGFLLVDPKNTIKKFTSILITGLSASVIMLIPILMGLLFGKPFHGASLEFAVKRGEGTLPYITLADYFVFVSLGVAFLYIIVHRMRNKKKDGINSTVTICLFLIGATTVCIYFFGGYITKSMVLASRTGDIYAMITAIITGLGFYCFMSLCFDSLKKTGWKIATTLGLAGTVVMTLIVAPGPIIPYKMEYNSFIEQYFRISKEVRDTEWLMVSQEEGYATCMGTGWHLMTGDFLELADPKVPFAAKEASGGRIDVPHLFIYIEEEPFETYSKMRELKEAYQRRLKESDLLKKWVEEYQRENSDAEIFYQDPYLTVIRIYRPEIGDHFSEKVIGPKE